MKRWYNTDSDQPPAVVHKRRRKTIAFNDEGTIASTLAATIRDVVLSTAYGLPATPPPSDDDRLDNSFRDAMSVIIVPMIAGTNNTHHDKSDTLHAFATALLKHSYRHLTKIAISASSGNTNNYEFLTATMKDACGGGGIVRASSLVISPILKYVENKHDIITECRLGWFTTDDIQDANLLWRRVDDNAASVNISKSMPYGAALITDVLARRVRLKEFREVVDGTSNESMERESVFFPLRTEVHCKYDLLTCTTMYYLTNIENRFRKYFVRALDGAMREAQTTENKRRQSLTAAQNRLTGLEEAIRTEQSALAFTRSQERNLVDQSKALHVLVANQEKDLRNRAAIELQKTQDEVATQLEKKFLIWQEELNELIRQRDALIRQATERAQPACRLLSRMSRQSSINTIVPRDIATSCRAWALNNHTWLREAERLCSSSGALILTTENIVEIDAIVQTCEPLRALRTQHLTETRQNLQSEEQRHERLLRSVRKPRIGLKDYADNMYDYLRWLRCFNETILNPTWSVACSDKETMRIYRSSAATHNTSNVTQLARSETSFMLRALDNNHVEYMLQLASIAIPSRNGQILLRERRRYGRTMPMPTETPLIVLDSTAIKAAKARTACVMHALVSDLRESDCPSLKENVFRELLERDGAGGKEKRINDSDVKLLTQRVFRWPLGIPEPEKRGLAFAMLIAVCPIDILGK